jgi:hypothetical protein
MTRNLIAGAALGLLAACSQGAEAPEQTIQQLMADEVEPTAQIYWKAVGDISELVDGQPVERSIRPETDEDWARVKAAATRLVEFGELLKTPGYAEGRGDDWIEFSDGLIAISKEAEQAAEEKDPDKVFEVGGTIYSVCSACHQVYPPAEGVPDGRPGDLEAAAAE